jgi:hypothetical protein
MRHATRDIVCPMRLVIGCIGLVSVGLVVSCGKGKTKEQAKGGEAKPMEPSPTRPVKQPVPTQKLPDLVADPGGASGKPVWAAGFGGFGTETPRGVAVDSDGAAYVCGYFEDEIDFGGTIGKRKSHGASDAFLVKINPDGKVAWAQTFGSPREDDAKAVAVRGDQVMVVGNFVDEVDIAGQKQKAVGSDDLFVAAFTRAGEVKWTWKFGGVDSDGANAIAPAPDGGWVVGGSFTDAISFGSTNLKAKGGTDALLVKLDPGGDIVWLKQFGGTENDSIRYVATDSNGSIYVQGVFRDVADWGGEPLKAAGGAANDIVLAKYDRNGDHLWSKRFGYGLEDGGAGGVAVDPAGNVTIAGAFDKTVTFGDKDEHTANGESDAFVAQFATDGKLRWAKTFGGERPDAALGVASDSAGNIVATGFFVGPVDFGAGPVKSNGPNKDVFAVKLDHTGKLVWTQTWGDHDHDQGRAIAIGDKGDITVAGMYRFKLDVAGSGIESSHKPEDRAPKADAFVARLNR